MDNEKWTHEVKNNDLADGLEDCKIFENILDNNLDKKTEENKNEKDGEITIEYIDKNPVDNSNDNDLKMEEQNQNPQKPEADKRAQRKIAGNEQHG